MNGMPHASQLGDYIRSERDRLRPLGQSLIESDRFALREYFKADLLTDVRLVVGKNHLPPSDPLGDADAVVHHAQGALPCSIEHLPDLLQRRNPTPDGVFERRFTLQEWHVILPSEPLIRMLLRQDGMEGLKDAHL
jgi:hypothetical protein